MTKLIVGLGNPGSEYKNTRHNIAWDVLEKLSFFNDLTWLQKNKGLCATKDIDGEKFIFLMPQTYMNLSGESVAPFVNFYKVALEDILVIHDELDLDFGTVAYKDGGGLAGHNGLKSIAQCLGNQGFKRLRVGIGRPVHGSVSSWVLSGYHGEDKDFIDKYLEESAKVVETYIERGFQSAARSYSKKKLI
ncbi:aminoacyl-tRNA hydrolase [Halobacteriovorax sp. HLS]|uniref:aminoacyl-tRNA hydrolase n=1 Tax=Halobacteriovorax sp. HLS TaxID=2234000 RepID=UPI000FDC3867|nr:aminoacyl-tRNA hydrolase [Halobacteriovorax sp. HLS]